MKKTIYSLGFFDGVHLGHQALLNECRRLAAETKGDRTPYGFLSPLDSPDLPLR